jgi:hypothetical protein
VSADEWADVNARAPEEYRRLTLAAARYGWHVYQELREDARAETLRVQLFGPNNYVGQVVFRARETERVMGAFTLGESVLGRYRAKPSTFADVLTTMHTNRASVQHTTVRRAA